MRHCWRLAGALAVLIVGSGAAGDVTVKRITYHGWPGAYRMTNGTVELVVVPQIGRILRYGYVGGPNVLWENRALWGKTVKPSASRKEWVNFGGDKLWPAPQARWNWPPDPFLDAGALAVSVLPGSRLRLTGQGSAKHGIRFIREIALAPTGTRVTLRNTMENISDQDVEWSVWEVAQVDDPDVTLLPLHTQGRFPRGYYVFPGGAPPPGMLKVIDGVIHYRRHRKKSSKIGSDSPKGWAAARKGGWRFTVSAAYVPGETYPDNGCAQEIYTNPDPLNYIELELLSPIRFLQPGDRCTFTTYWRLERAAGQK